MKLIIDIPKANYEKMKKKDEEGALGHPYLMAIAQGTPFKEPKTGYWIEHFDESGKWYECNQCHTDWGGSFNYCPNCGVKM